MGNLRGKHFRIRALGCRTNQYEAEAIASELVLRGALPVCNSNWDFVVLLSCTVTSESDRKCRQQVRRLRRENPCGIIVAAGCWAQELKESEAEKLGLDAVIGNRRKSVIPGIIEFLLESGEKTHKPVFDRLPSPPEGGWDPLRLSRPILHTRAFIKIQDGCDHFCSYCIVPFVRGGPVSRDGQDILDEVRNVAAAGCREVVLTGVHLGLYGSGGQGDLSGLVERIAEVQGISRIRFGSIEPFALDDRLVETLARIEAFCPHLHLPLQSGDDGVLAAMRRGYAVSDIVRIVERLRNQWPVNLHLSTDLLVGFPGESEEAFLLTLSLVEKLGFGRLHVFPFSPRPKTAAALMKETVGEDVTKERCERAIRKGNELVGNYASRFLGETVPVLVEAARDGYLKGLSPHFLPVRWKGRATPGEIVDVLVRRVENGELQG